MSQINETHDINLTSWVESANIKGCDFPIQNLPFAEFRTKNTNEEFRGGVAIGDQVIDLAKLSHLNIFTGDAKTALDAASESTLNTFMGLGEQYWSALRLALSKALREGAQQQKEMQSTLIAQADIEFSLPCRIGDYTDFYTSIYHATAVGSLFRPDNPLLPNYKWVPIGYHGRSSSIDVSGQTFHRPKGQTKAPDADTPSFGPCKRLDYELELGIYLGKGNALGDAIAIENAENHVFGFCVFNDWSARDLQAWEYQPLGPFLAKNFASTVSPWIVTTEALAPFRTSWTRDENDPQPMPYLESAANREQGAFDIQMDVKIQTQKMRDENHQPTQVSASSFKHSYWTVAQMVTHHTVNGCNFMPGDMLGSGTQSGPTHEEAGSLLELSRGGKEKITLSNGEQRSFLEDGDNVIMRGWCEKPGYARIGFGSVESTVLPAK
ncbi:Fumarylacetoacetate (FAA) hydrolase family protein [Pseudoalteromonas sp. P1-30]|uniref:fumarylacetoacetase n=1 Tax=unclassified Pseudoalteromonas TaxID=194690 RepID=UPI0006D60216|nr:MULTISPECIES: fumarylacetoacetase [unclassified Pseudoalteromonas]MDY6889029.1 fumarylacetoacetase [Pseudomonadota bacterium]KPV91410.1 Fumarylacetoacetate (FAA) hydrolase family protein [Pseudoalteromonas sp. P1-30]MCK8132999.1 fumarylacetoacetase [Pseudoalteromonas sp. 2CM28B]MDC9513475.1 fumarylacetoacetase [Pseudoalteromonas sp. CST1]MDC9537706.1 fumarylacetoacetase [Pseudoalteromonas sp. CST3]